MPKGSEKNALIIDNDLSNLNQFEFIKVDRK